MAVVPAALIFGGSFVVLLACSARFVGIYDEGIILTGALRVLAGEWPSRDFYTNYAPGQFILLAGFLRLVGLDSFNARLFDAAQLAGVVTMAWLLLRRILGWNWALGGALGVLAIHLVTRSELYPINPSILLVMCIAFVLVPRLAGLRGLDPCWPAAGLLGALMLFRYDLLPLAALGFGLPVLAILLLALRERQITPAELRRVLVRNAALLAALVGALLLLLWLAGVLGPALHDILTYNATNYAAMRDLPFPGRADIARRPAEALVYLAPLTGLVAFAALAVRVRAARGRPGFALSRDRRFVALLLLSGATAFLFTKGLVRTEALHMLLANVPAIALLAVAAETLAGAVGGRAARLAFAALPLLAGGLALERALGSVPPPLGPRAMLLAKPEPGLRALRVFTADPLRLEAARYVVAQTARDERILSVTGRHDKVFINDVAFYFATRRLPGTRWHHYDPGVQTSEAVQRAMIADIERHGVRIILRDQGFDEVREPNRSAESSGVTLLDRHIAARFEPVARFGPLTVLRRRGD